MGFTYTDLNDLLAMTRDKYPDGGKWVDMSTDVQEYIAAPKLLKKNKRKVQSGDYISWPVQIDMGDDGGDMGLYEEVTPTQNNQMTNATIRWGGIHAGAGYDLIEMQQNAESETRIVDLIKARRHGMRTKLYDLAEKRFWEAESTDGGKRPYSIFYWCRNDGSGTNTNGSFSGAYPFSGSTIAGIANTRMKNWYQTYTAVSSTDLLPKMRKAAFKCNFAPVPNPSVINTVDQRYEIFVNWTTYEALTQLAESRNENLGVDLNKMQGRVTFGGSVFTPVPYADSIANWVTYAYVLMIDWSVLEPVFLSGFDETETTFQPEKAQPNVVSVRTQSVYNLRCLDPRRLAYLSTY